MNDDYPPSFVLRSRLCRAGERLRCFIILTLSFFFLFAPHAHAQTTSPAFWQQGNWKRGCASLDMDFYNDRYYVNSNTTCDGTTGTTYSGASYGTNITNFINGLGASFTRSGTTNVTDYLPPFYLSNSSVDAFVSRASATNNVTAYAAPFYIGTTGDGPSQSFVSRGDSGQTATYFNGSGNLVTIGTGLVRSGAYYYNGSSWALGGTLIEPTATNSIRNNTMVGAVAADGVERTNNGTFSTSSPNVCSGSTTSTVSGLGCSSGTAITPIAISAMGHTGATVTVTTGTTAHGLAVGNIVTVTGAAPAAFNGTFAVSAVTTYTFKYVALTTPGTNTAVGSYTATTGGWVGTPNGGTGTASAASGVITLTGDNTNAASIYETVTTISGYYYTIAVTTGSGNAVTVQAGTSAGGAQLLSAATAAASATTNVQFIATGTTTYIQINNTSTTAATVTTVSVQSAGNPPTNWSMPHLVASENGLVTTIVGTGTDPTGISYTDFQISGTPTATGNMSIGDEAVNQMAASIGQVWMASYYLEVTAGSLTNFSRFAIELVQYNSSQAFISDFVTQVNITPTSAALSTQRFTSGGAVNNPGASYVGSDLIFWYTSGQAVNVTMRVGMPQMEKNPNIIAANAYATSVIVTSGSAVTRAADIYNQQPASYFNGSGSLLFANTNVARNATYSYSGGSWVANSGTLIEPAATNNLNNNMMVGAVVEDGVERTSNGTFSNTAPNTCSGSVTSGTNTLACYNGQVTTGWVGTVNGGTGSVTAATSAITLAGDGSNSASVYEAVTAVALYFYKVTVTTGAGGNTTVQVGTSIGDSSLLGPVTQAPNSTVTYGYKAAVSGTEYVQINGPASGSAIVTSVSFQSGGRLPTNWVNWTPGVGLVDEVVGSGTVQGMPYIDLKTSGTPTGTTGIQGRLGSDTAIAGTSGQVWVGSTYLQLVGGSTTNLTTTISAIGKNSGGTATVLTGSPSTSTTASLGTVATSVLTRYSAWGVLPSTNAYVNFTINYNVTSGNAVNITLRIVMPQLEQNTFFASNGTTSSSYFATTPIPTFTATTTRTADVYSIPNGGTYYNSSGVLTQAAVNAPRLDYSPTSPYVPEGLLIEESRTNLILYSGDVSVGADWIPGNASVTPEATTAPDGTIIAGKIVENTANSTHLVGQSVTITANTAYSYTLFVKAAERTQVLVSAGKSGSPYTRGGMLVNLSNGTFSNSDVGTPTSVTNRTVTALANGWYRVSMTVIIDASSTDGYIEARLYNGGTTYTGDGSSGLYAWGGQIESGALPTSYIPTYGSTVARSTDSFTVPTTSTGTWSGTWYNAGVGTLGAAGVIPYAFPTTTGSNPGFAALDDGTLNNAIQFILNYQAGGEQNIAMFSGGSSVYNQTLVSPLYVTGALCKEAIAFQANSQGAAAGGALLSSGSVATIPSLTTLRIGASRGGVQPLNGWVNRIWYMPTAQANASLPGYTQ